MKNPLTANYQNPSIQQSGSLSACSAKGKKIPAAEAPLHVTFQPEAPSKRQKGVKKEKNDSHFGLAHCNCHHVAAIASPRGFCSTASDAHPPAAPPAPGF
jgi:hypothetical protein